MLDSIVPALLADKNRKFIYVEQVNSVSFSKLIPGSCYLFVDWNEKLGVNNLLR